MQCKQEILLLPPPINKDQCNRWTFKLVYYRVPQYSHAELTELLIITFTNNLRGADAGQYTAHIVRYVPLSELNRLRVSRKPPRINVKPLKNCIVMVLFTPETNRARRLIHYFYICTYLNIEHDCFCFVILLTLKIESEQFVFYIGFNLVKKPKSQDKSTGSKWCTKNSVLTLTLIDWTRDIDNDRYISVTAWQQRKVQNTNTNKARCTRVCLC